MTAFFINVTETTKKPATAAVSVLLALMVVRVTVGVGGARIIHFHCFYVLWLIHKGVAPVAHLISAGLCIHGLQISLKQQLDGSIDQLILFLRLNNKNLLS